MAYTKEHILTVLQANGENVTRTAKQLGWTRSKLRRWLARTDTSDTPHHLLQVTELKKKLKDTERQLQQLTEHKIAGYAYQNFVTRVTTHEYKQPAWLLDTPKDRYAAIAVAMFSDAHFDEVVYPNQVQGANAYNRVIAERRLQQWVEGVVDTLKNKFSYDYAGLVLAMAGDNVSGIIHEELKIANEDTLFGTIVHWVPLIADCIRYLRQEVGEVDVHGVVGNHGRLTRKPVAKNRVRDNADWLMYWMLQQQLADVDGITFDIPESADCGFSVYDTTFLLTHGDQFRGGTGISGLYAPLMLGQHRKSQRNQQLGNPYDVLLMGHWHQLKFAPPVVVNGSLKGYDEYAFMSNFGYEPPQQGILIIEPGKSGIAAFSKVIVD